MLILKSLIIVSSALSSSDNLSGDQIFERFTTAFKDEISIQNWIKSTKRESIPEPLLFKEIIKIIGEVISVINTEKYTNIRSLFLKTNMTIENIGYPYLVTFNILTSTKRIISMYDELKTTANVLSFSEKTLYYEYDQIYKINELLLLKYGIKFILSRFHQIFSLYKLAKMMICLVLNPVSQSCSFMT